MTGSTKRNNRNNGFDVAGFRAVLLDWYDRHRRVMPWRAPPGKTALPYHVWLSEIMLQQTTVPAVGPYFLTFLEKWPSVHDLAKAPREDVLAAWAGLGYYARARNLHKCAEIVSRDHGGSFPDDEKSLQKLPGIGPYTSAAITAIAFDKPASVVDANVERVMARIFCVKKPLPGSKKDLVSKAARISEGRKDRPGDFAQALRSFLRHDPDVILVGEIRDLETAQTALKASMTGHVVLSTLHTNDAISAVSRLVDIGAERFLIGSTLIGVLAQRLVRRLCSQCRQSHVATEEERRILGGELEDGLQLWTPAGCPNCLGTGFLGRVGLFETFWVDNKMRQMIADGATETQIREAARGHHTLAKDSREKVLLGLTSLNEVAHLGFLVDAV